MFFAEWNVILYLCSPILRNIAALATAGLFINDLAMHDFSRDLLLTGRFSTNWVISYYTMVKVINCQYDIFLPTRE